MTTKPVIFISYAHADEPERPAEGEVRWLSFVKDHLRPAVKHGAVDIWVDTLMRGGDEWNSEIERKLRECDVFVLLVSRYSTSSDYVADKEIAIIRDRQKNREDVRFYPLFLTPTSDAGLDIVRDKNMRPRGGRPFSSYSPNDRDQHMADAANEIAEIAEEIAARKVEPALQSEPASPLPEPVVQVTSPAPEPVIPSRLPPNPQMIGREDRLEELVKAILEEDRPIVVPGALGMGKTTLALAAAHDARAIARFGRDRRFFVNLEPAPDAEGVLSRIAIHLGLPATGAPPKLETKIAAACAANRRWRSSTIWRRPGARRSPRPRRFSAGSPRSRACASSSRFEANRQTSARARCETSNSSKTPTRAPFSCAAPAINSPPTPPSPASSKPSTAIRCRSNCLPPMLRAKLTSKAWPPTGTIGAPICCVAAPPTTARRACALRSIFRSLRSIRRAPPIA